MAKINIEEGFHIPSQIRLEAKTFFKTLDALKDLGASNVKAFTYYEDMLVYCAETKTIYIWREVEVETVGVLAEHFVYPSSVISDGIVYSNRIFNFIPLFKSIAKVDDSLTIYEEGILGSNLTEFREEFLWVTGESQTFVLAHIPVYIISIMVNGRDLVKEQYETDEPNKLITITDELDNNDYIIIKYNHYVITPPNNQ